MKYRALQPIPPVNAPAFIRAALYAVEIGLDLDGRAATPFRRAMQATAAHLLCRALDRAAERLLYGEE